MGKKLSSYIAKRLTLEDLASSRALLQLIDRLGAVSQRQAEEIRGLDQVNSISALTHGQLKTLMDREVLVPELFDEQNTVEIIAHYKRSATTGQLAAQCGKSGARRTARRLLRDPHRRFP